MTDNVYKTECFLYEMEYTCNNQSIRRIKLYGFLPHGGIFPPSVAWYKGGSSAKPTCLFDASLANCGLELKESTLLRLMLLLTFQNESLQDVECSMVISPNPVLCRTRMCSMFGWPVVMPKTLFTLYSSPTTKSRRDRRWLLEASALWLLPICMSSSSSDGLSEVCSHL